VAPALAALDRRRLADREVNIGVLLASLTYYALAGQSPRFVFLVGILPHS